MRTLQELRDDLANWVSKSPSTDPATGYLRHVITELDEMLSADIPVHIKRALILKARDLYIDSAGDIAIDNDARFSPTDEGGTWVQGWFWVPDEKPAADG